jgi:hypothetical protein
MMQPGSSSFIETWINALTKPREETYAAIAASPRAKASTAYLWVFVSSIAGSLAALVVQGATIRNRLAEAGVGADRFGGGFGAVAFTLLCGTPIAAVVGTAFFAIWVALVQWIAKMFGGKGTNDQLAYALAAIAAPYQIISAVLFLLSAIPFVGLCFRIVVALAGIYVLVLNLMAVKSTNQFGWGPAAGAVFIPGLALMLVCCCVLAVVFSVMGVAIGNVFSTINQSLTP